jgi:hypothetical protein
MSLKQKESIKDVAIKEIQNIVSKKKDDACINLELELGSEGAKFLFLKNTQQSSAFKDIKSLDKTFKESVRNQTKIKDLIPDEQRGTTDKQSYFYFTSNKSLKGYSYLSSKGWLVTLICPQDQFQDLFKKDLVDGNHYMTDFEAKLDNLIKSNKSS